MKNTPETQTLDAVAVDQLQPHPQNPRRSDVGAVSASIEANGFYGAVLAQRSTRRIIAGHGRWQAARELGASTVPVIWLDVDDDRALRILIADNRTPELAVWDGDELTELLRSLSENGDGLDGTAFSPDALEKLLAAASPPDDFTAVDENLETEHRCPRCGYEWSGSPTP
jgi:ParB-like chromosome segregation protein Spo0J